MINISKEQLKELDGVYQMSHKCKDSETKKLAKAIFETINTDLEPFSIDTGYFYYKEYDSFEPIGRQYFHLGQSRSLTTLPIVVVLYIITNDDKYLKPSKYVKGSIKVGKKERKYIKFSNSCYFIDKVYGLFDINTLFKVEK